MLAPYRPPTTNLVDRLRFWAETIPHNTAYTYLEDGEDKEILLTFSELDARARIVAGHLRTAGISGGRALLLYPPGLDFLIGLFGCFYAGVTVVPAFPPRRNRNMNRIQAISENAGAVAALTVRTVYQRTRNILNEAPELQRLTWFSTDELTVADQDVREPGPLRAGDLAVLQYTSGSTGNPKGVMLTHDNIIHNCSLITTAFESDRDSIGMSWLPTYHDMGLIGGIFNPLFCGRPCILMSPMMFLQRPVRWLRAISRHRVTISGGPNFAYELCAKKIANHEMAGLDLSSWRVAFNGAEPVRASTLERFAEKFAEWGFQPRSFYPCYGMAETTLLVTGGNHLEPTVRGHFDASALDERRVIRVADDADSARELVGCGRSLPGEIVKIIDPDTCTPLPPDRVGEIWIHGPSVGQGYWRNPEATQATFHAKIADDPRQLSYLRSGDLGFFYRGELFVTGRLKDMIIVRGVNRYPQDIEMTVERVDARLRAGAAAAFAVDIAERERLVIVSEVERGEDDDWGRLFEAIHREVAVAHDLPPDGIVLVRTGSIPKTSSGKIQRHACRQDFLSGELKVVAQWLSWQDGPTPQRCKLLDNQSTDTSSSLSNENTYADALRDDVIQSVFRHVLTVGGERAAGLHLDTNIVSLGLDSLERLDVITRLEEQYGGSLPEDELPQIETVREVATAVQRYLVDRPAGVCDVVPEEYYRFEKMTEYVQLKRNMRLLESTGFPNPYFKEHERVTNDTARIGGREMVSYSTYNYLGMSGDPRINVAAKEAIDRYGTSVSASRLVSGQKVLHSELEHAIADFLGVPAAMVYIGGHATNETTIGHLLGPGDLILHDALAHNSIIQGAILSGARRRPFPHNDWKALDQLLREIRRDYRRVLVVIEGVYSMDGDYPELPKFIEVKQRHHALLMVDEAHSIGTMGLHGRGIGEHFDVHPRDVDIWMGTLSKSFGSCGGYIAGAAALVEYLKYTAPGFVYSVGLSPANSAAALAAIRLLEEEPDRSTRCRERAELFLKLAREKGLDTGLGMGTPVVPVIIGNSVKALQLSHRMFERGINVQPIIYPAVAESAARLRFFITARHTEEQIRTTIDIMAEEWKKIECSSCKTTITRDRPHFGHAHESTEQTVSRS